MKISEGYRPEPARPGFGTVLAGIVGYGVVVAALVGLGLYWLTAFGVAK